MAEPVFSPFPANAVYVEPTTEVVEEVNSTDENAESTATETVAATTAETTETVVVETTEATATDAPTVTETIREVEKIVEKYPEMDEYTGEIFQALLDGKEDVLLNYLSEKHKDYSKLSDYDVVKANILKANPTYTDEIAELKMERAYGELVKIDLTKISEEDEPEQYLAAQNHNKMVDSNQKLLKLDAFDARTALDGAKKEIKLPKIERPQPVAENLPTQESIEQGRRDWQQMVDKSVPDVKDFTYKIGDEDVSYKVSDTERNEMSTFLKEADGNKILQELGWIDKDGKQNIQQIAGDVLKLKKMQAIVSNAYKRGEAIATKNTVAGIKNIDLNAANTSSVEALPVDIGVIGFGHLNPK